jgi:hypothetical protein
VLEGLPAPAWLQRNAEPDYAQVGVVIIGLVAVWSSRGIGPEYIGAASKYASMQQTPLSCGLVSALDQPSTRQRAKEVGGGFVVLGVGSERVAVRQLTDLLYAISADRGLCPIRVEGGRCRAVQPVGPVRRPVEVQVPILEEAVPATGHPVRGSPPSIGVATGKQGASDASG